MKGDKAALAAARQRLDPKFRLVLLHGQDDGQIAEVAKALVAQLADPNDSLSRVQLTGAQLREDPGRLADEAAAVSMFGGARVIHVDQAGEESFEAVKLLLEAPQAGNPVILQAGALKKDSALLLTAERADNALALIFYEASARDLEAHAAALAEQHFLRLGRGVAALLIAQVDQERGMLAREIEKYALYLNSGPDNVQNLDAQHIAELGASYGEPEMAPLVEALLAGDAKNADQQMQLMGLPGIVALRAVVRQLWRLLELRASVDGGQRPRDVIEAQGKRIFWKEKDAMTRQLSRWTTPALRGALSRMLDAERQIKRRNSAGDILAAQALTGLLRSRAR